MPRRGGTPNSHSPTPVRRWPSCRTITRPTTGTVPVFSLDASVEKKLGNFSLYAKATNLLNTHYKRYIKTTNAYNYDFPSQSQDRTLIRDNYSGIGFMVGVRYKL